MESYGNNFVVLNTLTIWQKNMQKKKGFLI